MNLAHRGRRVCPTLSIRVHPGAEPWAPSSPAVRRLACWLSDNLVVNIIHRRDLPALWRRKTGRDLTLRSHAFRAWANDGGVTLVVDDTETKASVLWLLAHELAHIELGRNRLLRQAYRTMKRPAGYLTTDEGHEAHPEEQLANQVADQIAPLIGSRPGLNRMWWRRRIQRRN